MDLLIIVSFKGKSEKSLSEFPRIQEIIFVLFVLSN